jgi:ribonuclease HI
MPKQKFYVVWKGRRSGIFTSWEECSASVSGYPGAEYKAFESLPAAQAAFDQSYAQARTSASARQPWLFAPTRPRLPSLCVDAACAGVPGPLEFRGVITETGEPIFHAGVFPLGTNNIGEFLAVVHALEWLDERSLDWPIYSDSETALAWARTGKCRTNLARVADTIKLYDMIEYAQLALAKKKYKNPLLTWDTGVWGEIPADFGRK